MKDLQRERFEAWLDNQPPERWFDYWDVNGGCAICSFVRETTSHKVVTGGHFIVRLGLIGSGADEVPIPEWMRRMVVDSRENLTIANMKRRYLELFPEPAEPVEATEERTALV